METVITLIGVKTKTQDDNGVWRITEETRDIFARVDSITQSEFYDAGRNGINPDYKFTVFRWDYNGESVIKYNGLRYGVYRTFAKNTDELELYVERKGGTNG